MSFGFPGVLRWLWSAFFAVGAGFTLSGCLHHQVDSSPSPNLNEAALSGAFSNAPAAATTDVSCPWWDSFDDETLSMLVALALKQNPDVKAVRRRIEQANARIVQAGSTLFPQLDTENEVQRSWQLEGGGEDDASIGLNLNWELDLWGRIRSGRNARLKEAEAAKDDWNAARLLLTAAVAEVWFAIREQRGQLALAREQIELSQSLLDMTKLRFGQAQNTVVGVYQQQAQLESILALVPDLESSVEELELVLDSLIGTMPGAKFRKRPQPSELNPPPPFPETGVPSDLLACRPDLRAQRSRIIALDHEVGEAIADQLPRFSIGGSMAFATDFTLDSLVGNAVAAAVGPVFDGCNRKAEVRFRRARVKEELDLYTALFLDAAREVETALIRERKIAERIRRQETQLDTVQKLVRESRNQYRQGATDYLPVLDAVARLQDLERDLLFSRRELLSARVALHRAIGGPMPETPCEGGCE